MASDTHLAELVAWNEQSLQWPKNSLLQPLVHVVTLVADKLKRRYCCMTFLC